MNAAIPALRAPSAPTSPAATSSSATPGTQTGGFANALDSAGYSPAAPTETVARPSSATPGETSARSARKALPSDSTGGRSGESLPPGGVAPPSSGSAPPSGGSAPPSGGSAPAQGLVPAPTPAISIPSGNTLATDLLVPGLGTRSASVTTQPGTSIAASGFGPGAGGTITAPPESANMPLVLTAGSPTVTSSLSAAPLAGEGFPTDPTAAATAGVGLTPMEPDDEAAPIEASSLARTLEALPAAAGADLAPAPGSSAPRGVSAPTVAASNGNEPARFAGSASASPSSSSAPEASAPAATGTESDAAVAGEQVRIELALAEGTDATGAVAAALSESAQSASPLPGTASTVGPAPGSSGSSPLELALVTASTATAAAANPPPVPPVAASDGASANGAPDQRVRAPGDGSSNSDTVLSASVSVATSGVTTVASAPTVRLSTPVDSSAFPQDLAERVASLIGANVSSAKLQVNPPQLGPIDLSISVQGDRAQILMSTHSAVTREALESSAPQLRELLGAQGFGQVSVDVSQRSFQERTPLAQPYEALGRGEGAPAAAAAPVSGARASTALLDAYA